MEPELEVEAVNCPWPAGSLQVVEADASHQRSEVAVALDFAGQCWSGIAEERRTSVPFPKFFRLGEREIDAFKHKT